MFAFALRFQDFFVPEPPVFAQSSPFADPMPRLLFLNPDNTMASPPSLAVRNRKETHCPVDIRGLFDHIMVSGCCLKGGRLWKIVEVFFCNPYIGVDQ